MSEERMMTLRSEGFPDWRVPERIIRTVCMQVERNLFPPELQKDPIPYLREQLCVPEGAPFTGANVLQIARCLEKEDERLGKATAQVFDQKISPQRFKEEVNRPVNADLNPECNELRVQGLKIPERRQEEGQPESLIPQSSFPNERREVVTQTMEARIGWVAAKFVMFMLNGDDPDWAYRALQVVGFDKRYLDESFEILMESQREISPEERNDQRIAGLRSRRRGY